MARRTDPERILQAGRAAIRNRLARTGMDEATAERWCDAWELEAAGRGLPRKERIGKRAATGSQPSEQQGDRVGSGGARRRDDGLDVSLCEPYGPTNRRVSGRGHGTDGDTRENTHLGGLKEGNS